MSVAQDEFNHWREVSRSGGRSRERAQRLVDAFAGVSDRYININDRSLSEVRADPPHRCTIATRRVASLHLGCQHAHRSPCLPALRLTPRDCPWPPLPVCPPVQLVELVEDTQNVLDDVWRLEVAGGEPYPQGRMQRLLTVISGALGRRVQVRGCGGRWCWCWCWCW